MMKEERELYREKEAGSRARRRFTMISKHVKA